ncbi:embryonic protein UVS.2-like isoform X1 [Hyla sarda]|uniref:embryonic protein UVS.2-like isoform X1 n=1 Tax=Hyla sarda TaxID=327740 RepID=UPI0024C23886|nr:embryonic protein UVS.2-like isoform X1 [Hyla sarda]
MELRLVLLLCLASCPVSQALPVPATGGNGQDDQTDFRPVSEIIEEINRDTSVLITEGDIRPNLDHGVTKCTRCLWIKSQDGKVRVPYIAPSPTYEDFERSMFISAMKEFEVMTCVQFVNRSTENDYLSIVDGPGCWSYVGKIGGKQNVGLSMAGCIKYNLIQHELLHALGFYHEHTRSNRNDYIDIMWQNIFPGDQPYFHLDHGNIQDTPYDYNSILHYAKSAFSIVPDQPTMVPKPDPNVPMGQAIGLDNLDVMKINKMYNCNLCRQKLITPGFSTYDSTSSGQGGAYCLYLIQSTLKVLLQLSGLNISSSRLCSNSYIKVYDGVSQSSPVLLDKTCGSRPIPPLISSGSFMLIEIVNNQPSALSRFNASYETVRYGGTYVTDNGVVTSPRFASSYPSNVSVVYSIIAPKGYKVSLTFQFFTTQISSTCSTDYLVINDGPSRMSPILGTYCGSISVPLSVVSTGNVMLLQFHSEKSISQNGFDAQYRFDIIKVCDMDFRPVSDIIEEVNKDASVPLLEGDIRPRLARSATKCTRCFWIKSQDGRVRVPYTAPSSTYTNFEKSMFISAMKEFEVMTCVQFVNRSTENDYLSIEDGSGCWSYAGKMGGKQIVSLSMAGCIKYNLIQHELMHALGFYHEFTRNDRDDYIDVMWDNISPGDQHIFFLDNGNTQDIPYDYNSIVHYTKYAFSSVSGQPSMVAIPDPNVTMGQAIGLDNLDVMRINKIYNCSLCRQKLITPGSSTYNSTSSGQGGAYCLYLIQSTLKVLLQISGLNIPSSPNCSNSYIKVYDGVSQSSPVLLDKTCGNVSVPPLVSSESFMLIEIVNNQSLAPSTFTASYETVRYGETYVTDTGVVTSPGFSSFYPSFLDVVYSIIAPIGKKVSLSIYFFMTKPSPTCSIDYLIVNDGPSNSSAILGTYCGFLDDLPPPLVSTGNVMLLQFHSGNSTGYNGFYAEYEFVTS